MSDTTPSNSKSKATLPAGTDDRGLTRAQSTLAVSGVLQFIKDSRPELMSLEEEARQQCIEAFVKGIDLDGDDKISSKELYLALCGFYDDAIRANEEALRSSSMIRKYRRLIGGLVALTVALVATVFGTSFAAARLAKDTQVVNRALLTKDGQEPVGVNLNKMYVPIHALASMPYSDASEINELILTDDDGNTYHRIKQAIDISPGKSFTLRTTDGDTISWNDSEESTVTIALSNGKAWSNSVTDADALDEFVANVDVVDDGGRRLWGEDEAVVPPYGYAIKNGW